MTSTPTSSDKPALRALRKLAVISVAATGAIVLNTWLLSEEEPLNVQGNLAYTVRISLPPEATAQVSITGSSAPDVLVDPVAKISLEAKSIPLPFSLVVDPQDLKNRKGLGLTASIKDKTGGVIFATAAPIQIEDSTRNIDLGTLFLEQVRESFDHDQVGPNAPKNQQVYSCENGSLLAAFDEHSVYVTHAGDTKLLQRNVHPGAAQFVDPNRGLSLRITENQAIYENGAQKAYCDLATPADLLTSDEWQVEDIDHKGVIDNSRTSLNFSVEGRINGLAGCNSYSGSYDTEGNAMETSQMGVTRMLCLPALANQEESFLDILNHAAGFTFSEVGALIIHDTKGRTITARPN